jgi:hypothetical protein
MQTPQLEQDGTSSGIFQGVTFYHWLVVIIASCGWLGRDGRPVGHRVLFAGTRFYRPQR